MSKKDKAQTAESEVPYVNNLATWYARASSKHRREGATWYRDAHRFARGLSTTCGLPLPCVVGVLAVLSPRCSWRDNVAGTLSLLKTGRLPKKSPVLPLNVIKAKRILCGESPLTVLRGEKVRAFYHNILSPKTSQHVTIDIHAARAAHDAPSLTDKELSYVFRPKGNRALQSAYKTLARKKRLRPHKLQAIIWLTMRAALRKSKPVQLNLYSVHIEED